MTAEQIAELWKSDPRTECRTGLQTRCEEESQHDGSEDPSYEELSTGKSFQQPAITQIRNVQQLVKAGIGPLTSSMGRLFDGVASLVLGIVESGHEGEPAIRLEAFCDEIFDQRGEPTVFCPLISDDDVIRIDWWPIVRHIVEEIHAGRPTAEIAMQFHACIAKAAGMVVQQFPQYPVVLSGGCFQNRILTELVTDKLQSQGRTVATPSTIPCNDGGLAAGQLAIAAAKLEAES
jgi:hydrogenase maturation protein HypF